MFAIRQAPDVRGGVGSNGFWRQYVANFHYITVIQVVTIKTCTV